MSFLKKWSLFVTLPDVIRSLSFCRNDARRRRKLAFELLEERTLLDAKFVFKVSASANWSSPASWRLISGTASDTTGIPGSSDTAIVSRPEGPTTTTFAGVNLTEAVSVGKLEVHSASQIINVNGKTLNVVGNGLGKGVIEVGYQFAVPFRRGAGAGTVSQFVDLSIQPGTGTTSDTVNAGGVWVGTLRNSVTEGSGPQNSTLTAGVQLNVLKTPDVDGSGNIQIGRDATPGSTATMNVTGKTSVAGTTFVGRGTSTTGTLDVRGTLTSGELRAGEGANSNGFVLIHNTNTVDIGSMSVGVAAGSFGDMTISENSQVRSGTAIIGERPGLINAARAKGRVTVKDGSYLSIRSRLDSPQPDQLTDYDGTNHDFVIPDGVVLQTLTVGDQGEGGLIVQDGSLVDAQNLIIGAKQGSLGGVRVTGVGQDGLNSRLYVPGQITIGGIGEDNLGEAKFEILNGAIAATYKGTIGGSGSKVEVLVKGQNARFDVTSGTPDALTIGKGAIVTVQDGGVIEAVSQGGKVKINGTNLLRGDSKLKAEKMIVEDKQAAIQPGTDENQIATLTIDADFDSTAGVTYKAELGASDPSAQLAGESDLLYITGEAALGGDLIVTAPFGTIGYSPGSYFDVLTASSMNGQFENLLEGIYPDGTNGALPLLNDPNLAWKVMYGDMDHNGIYEVRLQVVSQVTVGAGYFDGYSHTGYFTATLAAASSVPVTVIYSFADGSAASGTDYEGNGVVTQTITFDPGVTQVLVPVVIYAAPEFHAADRDFTVSLYDPDIANTELASAGGLIRTIQFTISPANQTVVETKVAPGQPRTATVTVTPSALPFESAISFDYADREFDAKRYSDYFPTNGTLTWQTTADPNEAATPQPVAVPIVDDSTAEDTEHFYVDFTNARYGIGAAVFVDPAVAVDATSALATVNVEDDDEDPVVYVTSALSVNGGEPARLHVNLSAASGKTVTIEVSTRDGTAISSVNYVGVTTQTITFNPGDTDVPLDIETLLDPLAEYDLDLFVDIMNAQNATLGNATAAITIVMPLKAGDDNYSTPIDAPLNVAAAEGVLANDRGSGTLTVMVDQQPAHGTLSLNADGSFTYTPDSGYGGYDEFTYLVSDGHGNSATGTVTITVGTAVDGYDVTSQLMDGYDITSKLLDGYQIYSRLLNGYQITLQKFDGYDITAQWMDGYNITAILVDGYHVTSELVDGYYSDDGEGNPLPGSFVPGTPPDETYIAGQGWVEADFWTPADDFDANTQQGTAATGWVSGSFGWVVAAQFDPNTQQGTASQAWVTGVYGWIVAAQFDPNTQQGTASQQWLEGEFGWILAQLFDPDWQQGTPTPAWVEDEYGWVVADLYDPSTEHGTAAQAWVPGVYGWVVAAQFDPNTQQGTARQDWVAGEYGWIAASQFNAATQQGTARRIWM